MKFVDSHCHIDMILAKAPQFGSYESLRTFFPDHFEKLIHVCCHPENIAWSLQFIEHHPEAYASFGVHPHDANLYTDEIHQQLISALSHDKAVAWGECGLDYFYEQSPRDIQKIVFEKQLHTAQELKKPLILHTREADEDTYQILKHHLSPTTPIHVHCFTGNPDFAEKLLSLSHNLYFGFTGIITFKNAENVRDSLKVIPKEKLLLETDSPFLAPVPYRGKVAHPGMIPEIAAKMAEIKEVSTDEIMEICRKNTRTVYGI